MTFSDVYELIAEAFETNISSVDIYVSDEEGESVYASPLDYGSISIAGFNIDDISINGESYYSIGYVYECIDPSMQDEYEKRLILCSLLKGQKYNDEPVMLVEVSITNSLFVQLARIIYIPTDGIYEFTDNFYAAAAKVPLLSGGHEVQTIAINYSINKMCGQKVLQTHSAQSPEWHKRIQSVDDLYKSPLNEKYWGQIKYLERPDIYYGKNLVYKKGLMAIAKLGGQWVKLDQKWMDSNYFDLPQEIAEEFQIAKTFE